MMGTRLYPRTKNEAALEKLAGVPAGTAEKLREMEARHKAARVGNTDPDLEYRQWCEIHNSALGDYSHFLLYGWGKFDGLGLAEGYAGSLTDLDKCRELLRRNGISADAALAEGLYWC